MINDFLRWLRPLNNLTIIQMQIKRWFSGIGVRRQLLGYGFSIAIAFIIAFSFFKLFPVNLTATALTEPVLFKEGYLPFNNIADQKPPLLGYFIAAALPIFDGDAVLALLTLHAILVFITVLLALGWVYRSVGGWGLFACGVFFLAWSAAFGYWAILYFDIALTPFFTLALFFIIREPDHHSLWVGLLFGLVSGLAILIKQQALLLCALMLLSLAWLGFYRKIAFQKLALLAGGYLIGLALPVFVFLFIFMRAGGDLRDLVYWLITANLNGQYAKMAKLLPDWKTLRPYLPSLLLLPVFIWSLFTNSKVNTPSRPARVWLLLTFLSSLVLIYPRWSNRHLALALPFLAVISGITAGDLVNIPVKKTWKAAGFAIYAAVILWWGVVAVKTYSYNLSQPANDRLDAYSNFLGLAEDIRETIAPVGKIAIVPIDDGTLNLYYILNRRPPSFTFFNYPWFMERRVIQRWLDAMDQDLPTAVIYFKGRFEIEKFTPAMIDYLNQHYRVDKEVTWEGAPVLIMSRAP